MGSGSSKAKKGPAASAKTKSVKKQKPPVKVSKTKMENDAEIAPALLRRRDTIKRTMSRKSTSFNSKGRRKSLAPTVKQPSADSLASEGMERRGVSASFLEAFQTLIFENLEDGINLNQKVFCTQPSGVHDFDLISRWMCCGSVTRLSPEDTC